MFNLYHIHLRLIFLDTIYLVLKLVGFCMKIENIEINSVEDIQNSELEDALKNIDCVYSTMPVLSPHRTGIQIIIERGPTYGELLSELDRLGFKTDEKDEIKEKGNKKKLFIPWSYE